MKDRKLGAAGPTVFPLGIGAMSFSDFYGPTTEAESHAILDLAMDLGVNHIDTANVYGMGRSEAAIGSFLAARGAAARDHFNIATKAAISRDPETGVRGFDNSAAHLTAELEKSLKRMGIEAVDLFYVHRRDPRFEIEAVTESLAALVKAGKARSIGYSEIAPSSLRRAHAVHPVAAVQSEYSLSTRSPELGLVQACAELGVALVAFSPVGRSLLTDRPLSFEAVQGLDFMRGNPRFVQPNYAANIRATDALRSFAAARGEPAAAIAIAWLLAQGPHVIPIPGTRSVAHFRDLVRGVHLQLGPDDLAEIERLLPVGWAHGDRYAAAQWVGPERYC